MADFHVRQTIPTLSDELKKKRKALQLELSDIEAAENILAEHPEVKALFDIVLKGMARLSNKKIIAG